MTHNNPRSHNPNHGLSRPKKSLGQNFLIDEGIIYQIIEALSPQEGETLLEIGPGEGAITKPLLQEIETLTAIEIDRDLLPALAVLPNLHLIHGDILKTKLTHLFPDTIDKIRIVGNLPYNISTPILFHLLEEIKRIHDMHFMLQKEVVERMAASPNSKQYGRLSVMVQRFCRVIPLFKIPPHAFNPPPKVMSQIVRLIPYKKSPYTILNDDHFARVVKQAFSMRRKMIRSALKPFLSEKEIISLEIDPTFRAENLTLKDYVTLSNYMTRHLS